MAGRHDVPESPFSEHLGFETLVVDAVHARARLVIETRHTNPTGAVHGGTIIGLADNLATKMAIRANADGLNAGRFMVGIDLHAVMLRNQQGGTIEAESRIVRCGGRVTVVRTLVTGTDDRVLAQITTTHIPA